MSDIVIHKPSIDDLKGDTSDEHRFALFASRLLNGVDVDGHWLQIEKLNTPHGKNDIAIYEVDYGIKADNEIIGYIDLEKKTNGWHAGQWPYVRTNIALFPMNHWQDNHFNGNHTVKLQRFSKKPRMSFWIGYRTDWGALWIMPFLDIALHGVVTEQNTRFSPVSLPVVAVPNQYGTYCDNENDFTDYIVYHYKELANE